MVIAQEELARVHQDQQPSADQSVEIHREESLGLTGGVVSTVAQENYDHNQRLQSVSDSAVSDTGADFGDFFAEVDATPTASLQAHATSCDCGACGQQMQEQNVASESSADDAAIRSSSQDQQVVQGFFQESERGAETVVANSDVGIAESTDFGGFFAEVNANSTSALQAHATSCDCGACGQQMQEQNAVAEGRADHSVERSSSQDREVTAEFFQRSGEVAHSIGITSSAGAASNADFGDFFAEVDATPSSALQAHATSCDCGACGQQMQEQNAVAESRVNQATERSSEQDRQLAAGIFSQSEQMIQSPASTTVLNVAPSADFSDFFAEVEATPTSTLQSHATSCDCGACGQQMQEQDSSSARLAASAAERSSLSDEKVAARLFEGSLQKSERTDSFAGLDAKGISSLGSKTIVDLRITPLDERRSPVSQVFRSSDSQREPLSTPSQRYTTNHLNKVVEQRSHLSADVASRQPMARTGIPLSRSSSSPIYRRESLRVANLTPHTGYRDTSHNRSSTRGLHLASANYQKVNHLSRHLKEALVLNGSRLAREMGQSRGETREGRRSGYSGLKQSMEANLRKVQTQTIGAFKRQSDITVGIAGRSRQIGSDRSDGGRFEKHTRELQNAIRNLLKQTKTEQKFQQVNRYLVDKQHSLDLSRLSARASRLLDILNRSLPSGVTKFSHEEASSLQRILRGARTQKEVLQFLTKAAREKAYNSASPSIRDNSRYSSMRFGAIRNLSFRNDDPQQAQRALNAVRSALQRAASLSATLLSTAERRALIRDRHLEMRMERTVARKMLITLQSNSPQVRREILHAALRSQRGELLERARSFRGTPRYQLHRLGAKERVLERRTSKHQFEVKRVVIGRESLPRSQRSRERLIGELLTQTSPRLTLLGLAGLRTQRMAHPSPRDRTSSREVSRRSSRTDEQVAQLIHDLIRVQGTGKAKRVRTVGSTELLARDLAHWERVREELNLNDVAVTEDTKQMRDEIKRKVEERRGRSTRESTSPQILQILEMGSEIGMSVISLAQSVSKGSSSTPVLKSRGGAIRSLDHFQSEVDDEDAESRKLTFARR